jgi:glycerol uptake facilitator-like aquaporin
MLRSRSSVEFASELLGTMLLLAAVVGSGIMGEALAQGNLAVALLANAAATAGVLYVLITILGPLSGAHFNPAVSLVTFARGELSGADTTAYLLAQFAGAILGVLLAHLMFDVDLMQLSAKTRSSVGQYVSEGVATFGLVLTILGGVHHRPSAVPLLVASYIFAAYWFTASTSFANPAVTVARALTDSFSGIRAIDVPAFIVSQAAGAAAAALCARMLLGRPAPSS